MQGGGGPFSVLDINKPGRQEDIPTVNGHSGSCLNFDWNPFDEDMLASCSDDTTLKLWKFPSEGLSGDCLHMPPAMELEGHGRKVTHCKFHPTASGIIASVGGEHNVKLWDVESGACINENSDDHPDLIQDLVWDYFGNTYATTCKDKNIRMIDGRSGAVADMITGAHEGSKSTKLTYCGQLDKLLSVGFTRQSDRQVKIWDPRNTSKALKVRAYIELIVD